MFKRLFKAIANALRVYARVTSPPEEPPTKYILTIWKKSLLSVEWDKLISAFDVISFKAVDGSHLYSNSDVKKMVRSANKRGKEIHLWGFHYCISEESARAEALVAANACKSLNATGYHWNAEKQWAGSPDPQKTGKAFAKAFKSILPTTALYANSFNTESTDDMLELFDYFEPMVYGTKPSTISSKFERRMNRKIPDIKKTVMVGTGRKSGETQAWGYFDDKDGENGLVSLVKRFQPVSVNFFRGGRADGEDIMVASNHINPCLNDQVEMLKKECQPPNNV